MASIFSLYGEIFVDNEKAKTSLNDIKKKGEETGTSFSEKFGSIAKTTLKVGTAVVGTTTAVIGGLTAMATKASDTAGEISDASMRVGMSAEEYQKWTYAAKLSGMEASTLEKAMIKQQKIFADANEGSKTAVEAYKRLGINIKEVGSSSEAFDLVIARLASMENETEKNALANDIFGKSYAELTPLLNEGADGITQLKQEAVDLGAVMSNEAVSAGESFGDTIDKLKSGFGGVFNQVAGALFPVLEQFLNLIIENMPTISGLISSIAPILVNLLSSILPPFIQLAQAILPVIIQLINQLLPFITAVITSILPVIIQLIEMLLPPLLQIIQLILPLLISLIEPLLPLLQPIFALLQPFIDLLLMLLKPLIDLINLILPPIINLLSMIFQTVLPLLSAQLTGVANILGGVFGTAFTYIKDQVNLVIGVFKNIIDFVKNVFTGNWKGAWENVKNIFKNIAEGLGNIFKAPINFIIDIVNGFIKGLNKLKIPDWVPGVGGKGINIPLIKKLRVGMEYVPYDEMPALLHKGETVLDAEEAQAYRENKNQKPVETNITYNNTIVVEKMEVREESDIEDIAEELYYLQKKEVPA